MSKNTIPADATDAYNLTDGDQTSDQTDADGFPATYADPAESAATSEEPTVSETATIDPPAASNGKPAKKGKKKTAPKGKKVKGGDPAPKITAFKVPTGTVRTVSLQPDSITFDRRVQMRASLFNEEKVEEYRDILTEDREAGRPGRLAPLKAVKISDEEAEELKLSSNLVVWDGFHTGEAARRAGYDSYRVEVTEGDFQDARQYALQANADHGQDRTFADLLSAFHRLIENKPLLERILAAGKGKGGANRALAAATRLSKGTVSKVLERAGYATRGDKLVKAGESRGKPRDPNKAERNQASDPKKTGTYTAETREQVEAKTTASLIVDLQRLVAATQRRVETLLGRDDAGNLFRELASANGVPVRADENVKAGTGKNKTTVEKSEYWPAIDVMLTVFDELAEQHGKQKTKATE